MAGLTTSIESGQRITQAAILDWMERVRDSARMTPRGGLLDFDGVDALDVLASPIFAAVLNALRNRNPGFRRASRSAMAVETVRQWAHPWKIAALERMAARKSARPAPADILFWPREVTHLTTLWPVAVALSQQGVSWRMLACAAKTFNHLRRRDRGAVFALGAWPQTVRKARQDGRRRAAELARSGAWKIPALEGAPEADLEPAVRQTVIQLLPEVSQAIANARTALDAFRPKLLAVGNDLTLEGRAGCRVAASRKVPTALFMHGSIAGEALHVLHCADRLLVYGSIQRQQLLQQGIAAERIVICGAPHLDARPRQTGQTHPLLQARLGLGPADRWILVATSGPGHSVSRRHHQMVIENLLGLATSIPDVRFVVKLHRKDRPKYYRAALAGSTRPNLTIVRHDARGLPSDIFDWLQGCRGVLTGASAVALEAMLMDVPVITMDFCEEIQDVDFITAGATTHVRTSEELRQAVQDLLSAGGHRPAVQSRVRSHLEGAFHALDGRSASRARNRSAR